MNHDVILKPSRSINVLEKVALTDELTLFDVMALLLQILHRIIFLKMNKPSLIKGERRFCPFPYPCVHEYTAVERY